MPKRSNDYQRVVYYIHKHLSPDAVVTESAMLTDSRTGKPREIDVLVEGEVGGYPVRIAIEVRDHKRPADVQWIEQVSGKYESLPVDKVVVVSRAGFWSTALTKAASLGIEALTPTQDVSDSGPLAELKVDVSTVSYRWTRMVEGKAWVDGSTEPLEVVSGTMLFTDEGVEAGTLGPCTAECLLDQLQAEESHPTAAGTYRLAGSFGALRGRNSATGEEFELMLRAEPPDGRLLHLDRVEVLWEVEMVLKPVSLEHGRLRQAPFAFGRVGVGQSGGEVLVIVNPTLAEKPTGHSH
ncbi:hypothetical protein ACFTSF_39280 [Kribbella sp. NPDC056951]|uniref:hypothetical protein n=1 Tax=Kribbella sp. NPDC056951 TaxID=3345978 RepID=UPI00363DAB42